MSATTPSSSTSSNLRQELKDLDLLKKQYENDIQLLTQQSMPNESLIDSDGYPRNDIDIHSIRESRSALSRKQTDYKNLMKKIDEKLQEYYKQQSASK